MRLLGWSPGRTRVHLRDTGMHRGRTTGGHGEKVVIYQSRREASAETGTLILNF